MSLTPRQRETVKRLRTYLRAAKSGDASAFKRANNILRYYGLQAVRPGKTSRRYWTDAEIEILRRHFPHETTSTTARRLGRSAHTVSIKANSLGVYKSAEHLAYAAGRLLRGVRRSPATEFKRGMVPANKGVRRPGWAPGRMAETQFQPGTLNGVAAQLYKPIGAERINADGYLDRKVRDDGPPQKRWRAVHVLLWEQHHGQVPASHALCFVNGNKRDVRLDNLELIPRAELMRRNTIHNLPKPIADAIAQRAALTRQINRRKPKPKRGRPPKESTR